MKKKQFAVLGLGRFGTSIATTLIDLGHEVLAIDSDEDKVQKLADTLTHVVQADVTDEDVLRALGVSNVDTVIISIGEDIQASILATLISKNMGVNQVVAKAKNDLHGKVLEKVGADRVVYPERDMAERVAHFLTERNLLDYIQVASNYRVMELIAGPNFAGKTLGQLNFRAKYNIYVVVLKRGDEIRVVPGAGDKIQENDVLVLIGETSNLDKLQEIL